MTNRTISRVKEPDERLAPVVFVYIVGVVAMLAAFLTWVFYFRGYA